MQKNTSMGFDVGMDTERDYERVKAKVLDEMKRVFRPEFINRIGDIVLFKSLDKTAISKIVLLETENVKKRLAERGIELVLDESAVNFLIGKGWDEKFGARPLKRAIERELEDKLAEDILSGKIAEGCGKLSVFCEDGALHFRQKTHRTKRKAKA